MEVEPAIDICKYSWLGPACKGSKPRCQLREGFNSFISSRIIGLGYQGNTQQAKFSAFGIIGSAKDEL